MAVLHQQPTHCLGFDVAKEHIVVSDSTGPVRTIANDRRAIRALLKTTKADLAVCEPTGGHERLLLAECLRIDLPVHRVDTLKLKAFIRSFGTLGKTDALDAAKLAAYGRERWAILTLWREPDANEQRLKALVRRRDELVALRVAEQNRAHTPGAGELAASFKAMLAVITRQIKAIEAAIDKLVAQSSRLQHRLVVCTDMDGIGLRTAAALLAALPELGTMSRRQAAALAGLAPHPNESGLTKGYRRTRGGRPEIPRILYMAALRAAAGKGEFAPFYKRLINNAKKPRVALTAVMRKILVTLNARIRDKLQPQS